MGKQYWNSNTLATSCEELTHWKRPWCWEGLGAGGEGDDRGWDGCMASPTRWAWVWVNSGSWWWTGRPGVLWFMGSQRVGHDWATELNWTELTEVFCGWLSDFLGSRNQLKVFCKTKKDIFRIILLIIPKEDSHSLKTYLCFCCTIIPTRRSIIKPYPTATESFPLILSSVETKLLVVIFCVKNFLHS